MVRYWSIAIFPLTQISIWQFTSLVADKSFGSKWANQFVIDIFPPLVLLWIHSNHILALHGTHHWCERSNNKQKGEGGWSSRVWPFASERIVAAATATSSSSNNKQASNAGVVSTHCTHTYGRGEQIEWDLYIARCPHRPLLCATHKAVSHANTGLVWCCTYSCGHLYMRSVCLCHPSLSGAAARMQCTARRRCWCPPGQLPANFICQAAATTKDTNMC